MTKKFTRKHLLSIEELTKEEIITILDAAEKHIENGRKVNKKQAILTGRTVINLFFENSTRTLMSFEIAAKRLDADVINMQVAQSSVKKGESLYDTVKTLDAMNPDFIVMRHAESGSVKFVAENVKCSVINAGDGAHEHPTQALLDALTIKNKLGRIVGLNIAICGDILHSRVARSNWLLLNKLGAKVRFVAPLTLLPLKYKELGLEVYSNMQEGLRDVDAVMMLRLQNERMHSCFIPSLGEYYRFFGLDATKLAYAKKEAIVMHPAPINRGVEIASAVADDAERSVIFQQVEMGVAVRQAVFELLSK